jgi:hypothetical protein
MSALTAAHRAVLEEIGWPGIEPERLRRNGREFHELQQRGFVVHWRAGGQRPPGIFGGGITPGRWYLSVAGAAAIGLDATPLRLSDAGTSR